MIRPVLFAALLIATTSALTGCQSETKPAADGATAENRVLEENPKYKSRQSQVAFANAPRVD